MRDNNTLSAYHIEGEDEEDKIKLNTIKLYRWHIPKVLRSENIQRGHIVLVPANEKKLPVLVMDVYREDVEDTGIYYRSIIK